MESWLSTSKTILAAALGTLGVPIKLERMLDERSGKTRRDFYLGPASADGRYQTASLRASFERGDLARDQPDHPLVDIVYAKHNRDRLLDALNQGRRIQFVRQRGTMDRTFYQPGEGTSFPGSAGHPDIFETRDLNLVAAFARFGVPVLQASGPQGQRTFHLGARARLLGPGETVGELAQKWRAGVFESGSEHPFAFAMWGLINYARLVREMHSETEQVLIRKPGSVKSAYVDPATTNQGMDKVRTFFLG
jgi:hypothetical protein